MSFIEVTDLSKTFVTEVRHKGRFGAVKSLFSPQYKEVEAVKNVNLTIESGESVAYLGPNGAGKSTTIKMLSGILVPTSGEVQVGEFVPYKQRKKNAYQIGAVFGQRSQLLFDLPLIDSFEYLRYMYTIPHGTFKKKLDHFTEILDIHELLKRPVRTLSLGQRMRGEIIAALLHDPEVVFFDEPTIGLDVMAKDRIREFIRQINREENVTVLLTTHDLGDVERICPRLVIIDKGTIVYDGDLALIREKYATQKTISMMLRDEREAEEAARAAQKTQGLIVDADGRKVTVGFDQLKTDSAELMRSLLSESNPVDLSISDEDIEAIIKRIYEEGIKEEVLV
ncbi:MAG: ATP-binding cassette domain-containing protein [Spirochaetales bacterium]|nr:ATP-binding cassette domain-containing protein [Spirochaetales bacterium]